MGIHNLAIVFPQFIVRPRPAAATDEQVALVASLIFKLADGEPSVTPNGEGSDAAGKNGVAWVLRFGGLMALVGALICRKVPPTKTEKVRLMLVDYRSADLSGYAKTSGRDA